jgi:hypothetical protein
MIDRSEAGRLIANMPVSQASRLTRVKQGFEITFSSESHPPAIPRKTNGFLEPVAIPWPCRGIPRFQDQGLGPRAGDKGFAQDMCNVIYIWKHVGSFRARALMI